jgi:quinol monooxygenase YgiN
MGFSFQARVLPKEGQEKFVERAMQEFAEAMLRQPGVLHMHQLKDTTTGEIVGISFWRDRSDYENAMRQYAADPSVETRQRAIGAALQKPVNTSSFDVIWDGLPK